MNETTYDSRPDTYKHIKQVQHFIAKVVRDLLHRSEVHDASKLEEPELSVFNEYTPKLAGSTYGSDEYKAFLTGMSKGLDHHYYNNRHHPEYWCFDGVTFYPEHLENGNAIRDMNLIDLLEMLCDWKAATMRHDDGDIRKSIEINQKRYGISDDLREILINTLRVIEKPYTAADVYGA